MAGYCFNKWSDWIWMLHTAFREVREATVLNCQMRHWDGRTSVKWMKKSNVKWNSKFWKIYCCCNQSYFCFYFFFCKLFNVKKSPKEEENKKIQTSNIYPRPNIENQNYLLSVCTWVWEEGMYKWVAKRNIVRKNNCSLRMHNTKSNMRVVREIGA